MDVTGNQIDCTVSDDAQGAGLYASVIYTGGDMVIAGNTVNGEAGNFYSSSKSGKYVAYLTEAFGEQADIRFTWYQASSTSSNPAVMGYAGSDYTMTADDFAKLTYEDDNYDLTFANGVAQVAGKDATGVGGDIHVTTSTELVEALANASNRATGTDGADITGGTTNIILDNDIELEEQPTLSSGRYVTITSNGDEIYSITAGTALSGTSMSSMFYVGGNLSMTNVKLDAQQKGRVIETLGGASLTIGENATVTGGYAVSGTVYGVGIYNAENAVLTIAGGTVTGNTANDSEVTDDNGAVIAAQQATGLGVYNKGTLIISDGGSITNNIDYGQTTNVGTYTGCSAGGIYNAGTGSVNITGGTVSGNVVGSSAGGIYTAGTVNISGNSTISNNIALGKETSEVYTGGTGGGMYIVGGTVTLYGEDVAIEGNESMWGGGIYMSASTTYPTLNINGASIRNNTARITRYSAGSGGGIYVSNGAVVNMTSGTIKGNRVALDDDVDFDNPLATLTESLKTNGFGGGVYVAGAGSANSMVSEAEGIPVLNLTGGTITDNYAYAGGSGIFVANYAGGSRTSSIGGSYGFYGSGILNVSGSPVVSGNEDDDILLAAARYIDDDTDWQQRTDLDDNQHDDVHVYSEYRTNIIYPVYLHIVGELEDGADLHVSKELLTYDAETLWSEERTYDYQFDGVIVEGSSDYAITEENLDAILSAIDVDIINGWCSLYADTLTETDSDGVETTVTAVSGNPADVEMSLAEDADLSYTGFEITPAVTVTVDGTALTEGTDYTVSYTDNTEVGTAKAVVTGTGRQSGRIETEFEITDTLGETLALRRGNTFYISYSNKNTMANLVFGYGLSSDEVLVGDWDGDGVDTFCVRRGNTYYFTNESGSADEGSLTSEFKLTYGRSTDEVLVGDWDGDGVDTLCVRRGNKYYFINDLEGDAASTVLKYGKSTDAVYAGDWDGDGVDTLCVRRGNKYYFSNDLENTAAEMTLRYGKSSDEVLVGDWNDDGADTLCIRRGNKYYFSNDLESETAASKLSYGKSTDEVFVGRWR